MDVKVGDKVLFAKYAGTEFKLDDEELLILAEKDILADRRTTKSVRLGVRSGACRQLRVCKYAGTSMEE